MLSYLIDFYTISDDAAAEAVWTVDARLGSGAGMRRNPWGVAFDRGRAGPGPVPPGRLGAGSGDDDPQGLAEALVEYCERHRYVMLHASAFADEHRIVLVVGAKGSGKTTLALRAFLQHGCRYVSNDHLILYPEPGPGPESGRLVITSLPTPIPLKVGTYLDLERRLPPPWDDEGLDLPRFRAMPAAERYRHDRRPAHPARVPARRRQPARTRSMSPSTGHRSPPHPLPYRFRPSSDDFVTTDRAISSTARRWARGDLNPHVLTDTRT